MKALFVHENTLGHGSYLPVFAEYFSRHREMGIEPELLNATPLPPEMAKDAERTVPGLRRFGLDMHFERWRKAVSAHVGKLVAERDQQSYDVIVANTQSVALDLAESKRPIFVCLDATFRQLGASRWFSDPPIAKVAEKLNAALVEREQTLFGRAAKILPWSRRAMKSVIEDYGIDCGKIALLPPSIEIPKELARKPNRSPRALFVGADFRRKGGDLLLECYRRFFKGRIELDIVTESRISPEPGVRLWRGIRTHSAEWAELWRNADLFVFPSKLETFGIVLVEALAFGVPVISSRAGAAEEILDGGKAGMLLDEVSADTLSEAIDIVLMDVEAARQRAMLGRRRAKSEYNLGTNSARLAALLKGSVR